MNKREFDKLKANDVVEVGSTKDGSITVLLLNSPKISTIPFWEGNPFHADVLNVDVLYEEKACRMLLEQKTVAILLPPDIMQYYTVPLKRLKKII